MKNGFGRYFGFAALSAAMVATPLVAAADPIASRIASYRELGASLKNVNDELRSGTPQMLVIQLSARQIRDVARAQYGWFPAGSGPRAGVKTKARPEIWSQAVQFKAAQDAFATQANSFAAAAQSGDVERIRAAARSLGQACGACHRQFRAEN